MSNKVDQHVFDEAIRIGSASVGRANLYMTINQKLIDEIRVALGYIETGRIAKARDVLHRAAVVAARAIS